MVWGMILGAIAAGLAPGAADAKQVRYPQAKPEVTLEVPDDWTVAYTETGVELLAPGKDSLVVATLLKRDMSVVDAWKTKVLGLMEQHGVTVDAASPAKTASSPQSAAAPPTPDMTRPGPTTTPAFVTAGGPSLQTPAQPTATRPMDATKIQEPGATALPVTAAKPAARQKSQATINGLPFKSYRLEGGQFQGKPTDMQLVLYALPKEEVFAAEQQSGSEDNRASAILMSVKPLN